MKFLIVALALVAVVAAETAQPVPVAILRQSSDISPDGTYSWAYETENGISAQEEGHPSQVKTEDGDVLEVTGRFSYTGDDGVVYTVTYTADENGFHPEGAHLPVAPPVPEAIARSLEANVAGQNARPQPSNNRRF